MRVEEIQMLVADVVLPPPDVTVSQWADENRRLSSESAAERGEWRTDRAPYQRAIMDALSPSHPCEQVVLMSGAQLGKTSILENFIGYIIDLDPGPVLLVQPREADCEAFSKDRLAPMLRDCATLRGKVADARSRDSNNTILHKKFTGGSITMSAASSPAGLAMRSIRYCLLDEVDRYPASAGSEGDPVNLAITRAANFWNRKIVLCSTPTIKGASRIEAAWLESDQQMYWVPCPHCGTQQVLRWAHVEWPEGDPDKAQYRCEHCGQMIGEHQKSWMLKHGEWRSARPASQVAGFWINSLYSPWRKWRDLARKFLADQKSPETLREFINTVLAEPWDDEAQTTVDISELLARREHYRTPVPAGAAVLTCGVDVQADRLELELVGWGRGEESWSIEYRIIPGDPTGAVVWAELEAYLQRQWHRENGIVLPVTACCIDSGYESQAVYDFCRTRYHRRVFAVKGQGGPHPVWPKKPTSKNIRGERPWMMGTDSAKATIMGRLRNAQPGTPGFSHFPADRHQPYFEQLLGEALVTTYSKGQPSASGGPRKASAMKPSTPVFTPSGRYEHSFPWVWSWTPRRIGLAHKRPRFASVRLFPEWSRVAGLPSLEALSCKGFHQPRVGFLFPRSLATTSLPAENGSVWSRRRAVRLFGVVSLLAAALCVALVLSRRPILAHSPGEWDCACGDMYIKTTRHVIWNPLRDRLPEAVALKFLTELEANRCSAGRDVCELALPNHRVSAWKLAYREDKAGIVSLYFKLAKYGEDPKYDLTGVGVIDLRNGNAGWAVVGYDSYF